MLEGNPIFGDWGDSQDGVQIPTPVGRECYLCNEAVKDGDAGKMVLTDNKVCPIHRECMLLMSLGHHYGICICTKFAGKKTVREAALELDRLRKAARN